MYYLDLIINGKWMEYSKSEHFDELMGIVRGMAGRPAVRIRGWEGMWWRSAGRITLKFTPCAIAAE